MELLLVFLSTAVGTVVGVGAAILLMNRRNRTPSVGDAALRTQLQNTEWALASAGRDVEELRKQLAERDGVHDELDRTQKQLVAIVADKDRQSAARSAAEQRVTELETETAELRQRMESADVSSQRIAELEAALSESDERTAAASGEISGLRQAAGEAAESAQRVKELETALAAAEERARKAAGEAGDLRDKIDLLTAQANAVGSGAQELARRASLLESEVEELRAQAKAERERYERATAEVAELDTLLRKERQSAVEVMELLSQAQDKFSMAFAAAH